MVVADAKGIRIVSLDTRQVCYQIAVGAVSAAEMLFSTSLLAFVGSGARQSHSDGLSKHVSRRWGAISTRAEPSWNVA